MTDTTASAWGERAACIGHADLFERTDKTMRSTRPTTKDESTTASARAICRTCPVRKECLDAAQIEEGTSHHTQRYSLRGGLSAHERWVAALEEVSES